MGVLGGVQWGVLGRHRCGRTVCGINGQEGWLISGRVVNEWVNGVMSLLCSQFPELPEVDVLGSLAWFAKAAVGVERVKVE